MYTDALWLSEDCAPKDAIWAMYSQATLKKVTWKMSNFRVFIKETNDLDDKDAGQHAERLTVGWKALHGGKIFMFRDPGNLWDAEWFTRQSPAGFPPDHEKAKKLERFFYRTKGRRLRSGTKFWGQIRGNRLGTRMVLPLVERSKDDLTWGGGLEPLIEWKDLVEKFTYPNGNFGGYCHFLKAFNTAPGNFDSDDNKFRKSTVPMKDPYEIDTTTTVPENNYNGYPSMNSWITVDQPLVDAYLNDDASNRTYSFNLQLVYDLDVWTTWRLSKMNDLKE